MPPARLIYTSRAAIRMTRRQVQDLAVRARDKNRRLDVTGILLFGGGRFLQILEGDEPTISGLYDQIRADPRHTDCTLLTLGPASTRLFSGWRMALINLDMLDQMERRPLRMAARLSEALDGLELDRVIATMIRDFVRLCGGKKQTQPETPRITGVRA